MNRDALRTCFDVRFQRLHIGVAYTKVRSNHRAPEMRIPQCSVDCAGEGGHPAKSYELGRRGGSFPEAAAPVWKEMDEQIDFLQIVASRIHVHAGFVAKAAVDRQAAMWGREETILNTDDLLGAVIGNFRRAVKWEGAGMRGSSGSGADRASQLRIRNKLKVHEAAVPFGLRISLNPAVHANPGKLLRAQGLSNCRHGNVLHTGVEPRRGSIRHLRYHKASRDMASPSSRHPFCGIREHRSSTRNRPTDFRRSHEYPPFQIAHGAS